MPKKIIISKDEQGVKPKNFLKKKLDMSFKTLIKNLKAENIKLNGKVFRCITVYPLYKKRLKLEISNL